MRNKDIIIRILTVVISALLIFAGYIYIVGGSTIFKGKMEGETVRARVIRVTEVKSRNVNGESEILTVYFKAQALNTDRRGKTLDVIQEIDKSYAFSPKQVEQNDKILIESYTEGGETLYYFGDYVRITPLIWLLVIFCVLVIVFSKIQGLKTVISLGFTCVSVFCVLIPAILNGYNIYLWSIIVCVYITVMTLCIISGYNMKSLCAGIGCVCGVMCAGLVVLVTDKFLNMTGLLEEESVYLYQLYPDNPINLKAVIFAMIIVGALGAVMDVSMSIS
ncbi:MAG: YibE/F family protein [Clostridia bacterium]|nr:YibE/F family protein [Clostridia bacterium]